MLFLYMRRVTRIKDIMVFGLLWSFFNSTGIMQCHWSEHSHLTIMPQQPVLPFLHASCKLFGFFQPSRAHFEREGGAALVRTKIEFAPERNGPCRAL